MIEMSERSGELSNNSIIDLKYSDKIMIVNTERNYFYLYKKLNTQNHNLEL